MSDPTLDAVGFGRDDAAFVGSRFSEVREAIFANPYQRGWGGAGEAPLPRYTVGLGGALAGILPFGKPFAFLAAARRAVDSQLDLRWGEDGKGFRRILHTNAVCLTGRWKIDQETPYSGYFRQDSQGLLVCRYSTCCTETRRGNTRSLSLVGRLYPTTDPQHAERLPTANFITQQDLGGENSRSINEAITQNAPNTTAWRRGLGTPVLLLTGIVFQLTDQQPSFRQLYQIAELGKPDDEPTRAPEFMRLVVDEKQPVIPGDDLDFRDEVMAQIYDPGDPAPKRKLVFHVETSDEGETKGLPIYERRIIRNWRRIGTLAFDEAVVSYNGDFVLGFNHPVWRNDRNDPSTARRKDGQRV